MMVGGGRVSDHLTARMRATMTEISDSRPNPCSATHGCSPSARQRSANLLRP